MEKVVAILGMLCLIAVSYALSSNRRAINWRTVVSGFAIQFVLALLILKVPFTRDVFFMLGQGVEKLLDYAVDGAAFVVGDKLARGEFIFVVRVGASIIFVAALASLLYFLGIMQRVVKLAARLLTRTMGISGPEAVSSAAAVFVGQVECQVLIKPYMASLTRSELFCSMTAAMATISGSALVAYTAMGMNPTHLIAASIMSAFAGISMAKIFCPETETQKSPDSVELAGCHKGVNAFDALANGATDGARIAINVMVMVLVAVAMVAMINGGLGALLKHVGLSWQVQDIVGVFFTPIAWLLGTPWHEAFHVGRLMATEIVVNEFAAYGELSRVIAGQGAYVLAAKTQMIATMALCGFANLGSIAINIGGLGAMCPERRHEIAGIAFRALIAANFASWVTAAIAGLLF
jgi:CNT family concentrative nucleoside transporter